jgi:hypothetical protein
LLRRRTKIRKSKVALISIAAVATVAIVSPAFAQLFSASPCGTGNVLSFTYQPITPQKDKIAIWQGDQNPLGSCDTPVSRLL